MVIDLRSILHGAREFHFLVDRNWWQEGDLVDSIVGISVPFTVNVSVSSSGSKYLLDGHLSGALTLRCDRCLRPYEYALKTGFHVVLATRQTDDGRVEVELFKEDLSVDNIDGFVIDLSEVAREQVLLELPIKKLCSADCAGLCPKCGKNLTSGECGCETKAGHPGFLKLKQLKIKGD